MAKKLPYGNSNFGSIIDGNYCYVDKTRYIELLENEANRYQFFIRPRKFGKSLFFSMLLHYYDLNRAADFQRLFGNLYIGKNPTPRRNGYMVMRFNFSGMNTAGEDAFTTAFTRNVQQSVLDFVAEYRPLIPGADDVAREIKDKDTGIDSLRIAYQLANTAGKKIYVIIDEYDHFANDLIATGKSLGEDVYRRMVRANGLVRDFYETLKIGTSDVLEGLFITGISPVMLDDLTSGFNIAVNLTLERRYNEMLGFSKAEVDLVMAETGVDPALISVDMEAYYNGYLFHKDGAKRMYNPNMVLYFFYRVLVDGHVPENIIDDNLKTDYGRLQRLVREDVNRERLLEIAKEGGVTANIISKFSIDRLDDTDYFISLLVYMGLLTIDKFEQGRTRLKIPNYSIQTLYWEYIVRLTQDTNNVFISPADQEEAIHALAYKGDPAPYIDYVTNQILGRLSNRDLVRFDEKYIKIMLLNGLFQSRIYVPISELEVDGGYIDIRLERSPLLPDIPYEWVWEIKYLKKGDTELIATKKAEALAQLERYKQSKRFADRQDIRYLAILFIGKDGYEIAEA